jgi:hypothetical protein
MMEYNSFDCETPEGDIALLCTPSESYFIETWEDFRDKFMVYKNLRQIFFNFNIRFDCSAIIKLLPMEKIRELWNSKKNTIKYDGYRITWIPKKFMQISVLRNKQGAIHVYDVSQYYKGFSLDNAAKTFLGIETGKNTDVSAKEIGKSRRYYDENLEKIVEYCKRDAFLTLELAKKQMRIFEDLHFPTKKPVSIASISRKYQRKSGYPPAFKDGESEEKKAQYAGFCAYRGGIFNTMKRGMFETPLYDFDINSAYPAVMKDLPDWRNGRFEEVKDLKNYKYAWIVVETDSEYIPYKLKESYMTLNVYEDIGAEDIVYRNSKVVYPVGNRPCVITLDEYKWLKTYGENVEWLGRGIGWVEETEKYPPPFAWVAEMYENRRKIKKVNFALQWTMKILMNSIYGSTAQKQHGIGDLTNFNYASLITAGTRLQIWDVVHDNYDSVVNIATDGILLNTPVDTIPISDKLGEWSLEEYSRGLVVGNGVMVLWDMDGEMHEKIRSITSSKKGVGLFKKIEENSSESKIDFGASTPVQVGTIINSHLKFGRKDINRFIYQGKRIDVNSDRKRTWDRDYENYGDLLRSEPMKSKPLRVEDIENETTKTN